MNKNSNNKYTFKKGRYYVGDTCYALGVDYDFWQRLCKETFKNDPMGKDYLEFENVKTFQPSTAHGDGEYLDTTEKYVFGVDSGVIGCVSVEDLESKGIKESDVIKPLQRTGYFVDFKEDFECFCIKRHYNNRAYCY